MFFLSAALPETVRIILVETEIKTSTKQPKHATINHSVNQQSTLTVTNTLS
jgi:hypothetical protein